MSDTFLEITPSVAAGNTPDALRSEVLRRMKVYVLEALIDTLALRQASPTNQNSSSSDRRDQQEAALRCSSVPPRAAMPLRVLHTARNRLLVLAVVFANVLRRTVQTQRDVYYHLVREVPTQAVVNRTVLQLARALRVPRELMGVTAGGRGFIAGALSYHGTSLEGPTFALEGMPLPLLEADLCVACVKEGRCESESCEARVAAAPHCRHVDQPEKISANTDDDDDNDASRRGFCVSPNVRFILVIEKHAVFSHLLRGGLLRRVPCVLLTAQGCPPHAAHRLLANLHAALPQAAVVGLVDYNPHGLAILSAYRWPSSSYHEDSDAVQPAGVVRRRACAMPENRFCAVPALRWLGVRAAQVRRVEEVARRNAGDSATRSLRPAADDVRRESLVGGEAPFLAAASVSAVEESDHLQATDAASSLFRPVPEPPRLVLPPLQPLFSRDAVVLDNLITQLETRLRGVAVVEGNRQCGLNDTDSSSVRAWLQEAQQMRRHGVKCELEALYTAPFAALFCGTAPLSAFASTSQGDGDAALMTTTSQPAAAAFVSWVAHQLLRGHFV